MMFARSKRASLLQDLNSVPDLRAGDMVVRKLGSWDPDRSAKARCAKNILDAHRTTGRVISHN